jgi:hypothetical protein
MHPCFAACRYNFLLYVPYQLERIMIFGTLLCLYSFLVRHSAAAAAAAAAIATAAAMTAAAGTATAVHGALCAAAPAAVAPPHISSRVETKPC